MVTLSTFLANLSPHYQHASWALGLTWTLAPRLLVGVIGCNLVQGITPFGLALAARGIVNEVVDLMSRDGGDTTTLILWLAAGFILAVSEALSKFSKRFCMQRLQDELNLKITSDILTHAASLDLSRFEDPEFLDTMQRAQQNTASNFAQFIESILTTAKGLIQSGSLIGLLIVIEPIVVLLLLPIALPYLVYQWKLAKTRYEVRRSRATKRRWASYFVGKLTNQASIPEVRVLGLGPLLQDRFRMLMHQFKDQDRRLYLRQFLTNTVFTFLSTFAAYLAFSRVAFRVLGGGLTVGDVAIFGGAAIRLKTSMENTIMSVTNALEQMLYISNLKEFHSIEPRIRLKGDLAFPSGRGEVALENVSFSYPGSDRFVLKGVSFHVQPGETVALVGENGAGKTTLVKLIARLYDPDEGRVCFDRHDVRDLSLDYLHGQMALILQGFGRYEATVSENIAYGDWQRLLHKNEAEIREIAQKAGIHDMIEEMPQGYETPLGRLFGAHTLSAGQWQRLALARAFARNAALLILDEPTSNLDARAEYDLYRQFKEIAEGRSVILISHRFSTVSMADRILVLDRGEIIEQGTHQDLLTQGGHYATLFKLHQRQMGSAAESDLE